MLQVCDMVVWAGISFQQSASVEYFRRVRHMLGTLGRLNAVPQVGDDDCPYSTRVYSFYLDSPLGCYWGYTLTGYHILYKAIRLFGFMYVL